MAVRADLLADGVDGLLDDVEHRPGRPAACGAQEVLQQPHALIGVDDLGVKLHAVQAARRILERCDRSRGGRRRDGETIRRLHDRVSVRHPDLLIGRHLREQHAGSLNRQAGSPVLGDPGRLDATAQGTCHDLVAVADTEHRHPGGEQPGVDGRSTRRVDRFRPARQDDRLGLAGQQLLDRRRVRDDLGVDVAFTDATRDELRVLGAEVDDENGIGVGVSLRHASTVRTRNDVRSPGRATLREPEAFYAARPSSPPSTCSASPGGLSAMSGWGGGRRSSCSTG